MHEQARRFTEFVMRALPERFVGATVLDVGGGDINGTNKDMFDDSCTYVSNDVSAGPNVTVVSRTASLTFPDGHFDVIVSTECFEHDPEWEASWQSMYRMLAPGGLLFFTCASTGRAEHGTRRTTARDSFGTMAGIRDMQDYYRNITHEDVKASLKPDDAFALWDTYYNSTSKDLYFVSVKVGAHHTHPTPEKLPVFEDWGVWRTTR